jgi:hypothetical protein
MPEFEHFFTAQADWEFQTWFELYGDNFYHMVDRAIGQIALYPESAPVYDGSIRRMILPKTPLGLFYGIHGNRIAIIAILDLRQNPKEIKRRLK